MSAHAAALDAEKASHAKTSTELSARLEESRSAKEEVDRVLASSQVIWGKQEVRMQLEIDSLRGYSSSANRALHDNTTALRAQLEQQREELEEKHRMTRDTLLKQNRALQDEVDRLRRVQSEVLHTAEALPGGDARQYLFFEASKTRRILSAPDTTISWRGVHEEPPPRRPPPSLERKGRRVTARLSVGGRASDIPPGVLAAKAAKAAKLEARGARPESARQPRQSRFG